MPSKFGDTYINIPDPPPLIPTVQEQKQQIYEKAVVMPNGKPYRGWELIPPEKLAKKEEDQLIKTQ